MSAKHAVERPGDLSKGWNAPLHAQTNRGDGEVLLIADHSPINSGTLLLVDHSARNIVSETVAEEVVGETKTSLPLALQGISSWIPGLVVESSDGAVLLDTLTKKAVAVYIASGFQAKGDDERRGVIQRLKGEDGIRIRAEIKGALEAMRGAFVEYEFSTGERNKVIGALNLCESAFSLEQAIRASETAYAAQGVEGFISPLQEIMDRRRAAIYRQFDGVDAPAVSATSTNRRTSVSLLGAGALAIAVAGAAISSHPAVQRFVTNMGFNPPAITLQNPSTEITPTAPIKRVSAVTRAAPLPLSREMIQTAVQNDIDVVSRPEMRSVNGQLLVSGRTGLYRLTGGGYELVRRYGENESEATHFELSRPSLGRD
jgi:hypothetical protein